MSIELLGDLVEVPLDALDRCPLREPPAEVAASVVSGFSPNDLVKVLEQEE
jgi:hypothetical protein